MLVGQLELLRDENIEYARRLMQAGVPTELHVFPAAFHAFELAAPDAEISRWAIKAQIEALKTGLHCNLSR
jgi:acetyl esterase/lipase